MITYTLILKDYDDEMSIQVVRNCIDDVLKYAKMFSPWKPAKIYRAGRLVWSAK